jgi:hypothetical protein
MLMVDAGPFRCRRVVVPDRLVYALKKSAWRGETGGGEMSACNHQDRLAIDLSLAPDDAVVNQMQSDVNVL